MILAHNEILKRLNAGDIFRSGTWCKFCLREASYALRIANDALLIDGKFYDPGEKYTGDYIKVEPGKIAILSTKELLNMPADLVGKIGIRLEYAHQGLTGLMGIQVDPLHGRDKPAERLYIRVANLGNEAIQLSPGDEVFTFELHQLMGRFTPREKGSTWLRMKDELRYQSNSSWSYATRVESDLLAATQNVKDYFQPLVMFGVFLVAVSILAASISVLLRTPELNYVAGSSWLDVDKQNVLLWVLLVGIAGTAWVGLTAGWRFFRPYQSGTPRATTGWRFLRPYRTGTPRTTTGWIRKYWRKFWHWLW